MTPHVIILMIKSKIQRYQRVNNFIIGKTWGKPNVIAGSGLKAKSNVTTSQAKVKGGKKDVVGGQ